MVPLFLAQVLSVYTIQGQVTCDPFPRGPGPVNCYISSISNNLIPKPTHITWATLSPTKDSSTWCIDKAFPKVIPSVVRGDILRTDPGPPLWSGHYYFQNDIDLEMTVFTQPKWTEDGCNGGQGIIFAPLISVDVITRAEVRIAY